MIAGNLSYSRFEIDHCTVSVAILKVGQSRQKLQQDGDRNRAMVYLLLHVEKVVFHCLGSVHPEKIFSCCVWEAI